MKNRFTKFTIFLIFCINSGLVSGQWNSVLDNVVPVDIAISPDYIHDQTIYILDDVKRLLISETGGINWTTLYEATDPSDPAQSILDIVISPNFKNDNAIVMIHKDGTAELSADRGQQWFTMPVPEGTTGIVFSPKVMEDYKLFAITGAYGPVKFYKSGNGGATWSIVSDLGIGGGFYCRLWNSSDTASVNHMAVLYDNRKIYLTEDAGVTWNNSFNVQVSARDLVYSPRFSVDHTMYLADASEILKNENGGDSLSWESSGTFTGSFGIRFAISPGYQQDQSIFAAVDQLGIMRSVNGGTTWNDFNDGFGSILPISIAISGTEPYTLYAGSTQTGGAPDKFWRFQTSSGIADQGRRANLVLLAYPNPFSTQTQINFETPSKGHVQLIINDLAGKKMKLLVDEYLEKGFHRVNLDCEELDLKPGIYFCSLEYGTSTRAIKLIVRQR
jgi:photosystem II stability/assembly factor-like uncharacterized protein